MSKILLLFLFISCTMIRVMEVGKFNQQVEVNFTKIHKSVIILNQDLKQYAMIKTQWDKFGGDERFNVELSHLNEKKEKLSKLLIENQKIFEQSKFRTIKKVTSQDKNYAEAENFQKTTEENFNKISSGLNEYQKSTNELKSYLNNKKIYRLDIKKVQVDFNKAFAEAAKNQTRVKSEIKVYEKKSGKNLGKLKTILNSISAEISGIRSLFQVVSSELKTSESQYVVPGMKAHDYLQEIQKHAKTINAEINRFNEVAKSL